VKTHVENIYKKLGATNRAEAVEFAERAGLLARLVTEPGESRGSAVPA
jgi:Bacterial regulatory proteins, luxR family